MSGFPSLGLRFDDAFSPWQNFRKSKNPLATWATTCFTKKKEKSSKYQLGEATILLAQMRPVRHLRLKCPQSEPPALDLASGAVELLALEAAGAVT